MRFSRWCFNFFKQTEGAVVIMVSSWLLPAILITGLVIDVAHFLYIESKMAYAADAGALAAARYKSTDYVANGKKFFHANFPTGLLTEDIEPVVALLSDGKTIQVIAEGEVPSFFGGIVPIPSFHASVTAQVRRELLGVEVALVLDNTGSMNESA